MAQKHLLTLFHCVVAAVVTPVGWIWAGTVGDRQPLAALLVLFAATILPVLIATRVAWAAGYAAGREASEPAAPIELPPTEPSPTDTRIRRITRGPGW